MNFEYIYNIFPNLAQYTVSYNPQPDDALLMAQLCLRATTLQARNGKKYWYFFLKKRSHIAAAKLLLRRNGLYPAKHWSKYYSLHEKTLTLRVQKPKITTDAQKDFVHQIQDMMKNSKHTLQSNEIDLEIAKLFTKTR